MLDRVALHQRRFRTPGVAPDARGILLGPRALLSFPALDRLVAFLRAWSEEASLDELAPGLALRRVVTPLRTRELVLWVASESSTRLDRLAAVARLTGGLAFTGASRHFVAYRDAEAPLGWDVRELLGEDADLVLYHPSFTQAYRVERELSLADLLLRLAPVPLPRAREAPLGAAPLLVLVEPGLAPVLVAHLIRAGVRARMGVVERAEAGTFEARARRLHVFELSAPPARTVALLRDLPGVTAFRRVAEGAAVELGFAHPVALDGAASVFPPGSLALFRGRGPAERLEALPPLVPVDALVAVAPVEAEPAAPLRPVGGAPGPFAALLPLRLAPTMDPPRRVTAVVVPAAERPWLARLLYALPPRALERLRVAVVGDRAVVVDPEGVEGLPIGTAYTEVTTRVHVPVGLALVPSLAPEVLAGLVPAHASAHVFFDPDGATRAVPLTAFGPVAAFAVRVEPAPLGEVAAPALVDPPLTRIAYGPSRAFPLRGAAGSAPDEEGVE